MVKKLLIILIAAALSSCILLNLNNEYILEWDEDKGRVFINDKEVFGGLFKHIYGEPTRLTVEVIPNIEEGWAFQSFYYEGFETGTVVRSNPSSFEVDNIYHKGKVNFSSYDTNEYNIYNDNILIKVNPPGIDLGNFKNYHRIFSLDKNSSDLKLEKKKYPFYFYTDFSSVYFESDNGESIKVYNLDNYENFIGYNNSFDQNLLLLLDQDTYINYEGNSKTLKKIDDSIYSYVINNKAGSLYNLKRINRTGDVNSVKIENIEGNITEVINIDNTNLILLISKVPGSNYSNFYIFNFLDNTFLEILENYTVFGESSMSYSDNYLYIYCKSRRNGTSTMQNNLHKYSIDRNNESVITGFDSEEVALFKDYFIISQNHNIKIYSYDYLFINEFNIDKYKYYKSVFYDQSNKLLYFYADCNIHTINKFNKIEKVTKFSLIK